MKKICALFLAALLLAVWMVPASATNMITVAADQVSGAPGSTVSVKISLPDNPGVNNIGFSAKYDADALTYKGYTIGGIFSDSELDGQFESSNPISMSFVTGKANKTAVGTLITLKFQIRSGASNGEHPIILETGKLGGFTNIEEENLFPFFMQGSVNVVNSSVSPVVPVTPTKTVSYTLPKMQGSGSVFVAQYQNGRMTGLRSRFVSDLTANNDGTVTFANALVGAVYRVFLLRGMMPLCEKMNAQT